MPNLFVLADERAILANVDELQRPQLHLVDELVFNRLCELMDVRNGNIGFTNAVSMGRIASELRESMARKAVGNRVCLDLEAVRRSIKRLVDVGLFERRSVKLRLQLVRVFWREFALVCNAARNPETRADTSVFDNDIKQLSWLISGLHDFQKRDVGAETSTETILNKPSTTTRFFDEKFTIETSYVFKDVLLDEISALLRFDYKKIDARWRDEFLLYQRSQGKCLNEYQWHDKFCREMKVYVLNPSRFDELNGRQVAPSLAVVKVLIPAVPHYTSVDAMSAFARKYDFAEAKPGESGGEFNRRLNAERTKRLDRYESENIKGGVS